MLALFCLLAGVAQHHADVPPAPASTLAQAPSSTLAQAPTDAQCLAQIMALSAIYGKLNGDLWTKQRNWLDTTGQCGCDWWGVYCEGSMLGDMNVTNLQLSYNDASGFLPAMELIRLPRLERVALNGNQIGGAIPDEMGQLFSLQILDLSWNNLDSFVPPKLGSLANLTQLLLYHNRLTGPLPATLGNLTKLERLYADRNHFSGGIPDSFGRLHSLLELSLFENNLTSVPKTLVDLRHLTTLALQSNAISGPLDPALESLAQQLNRSRPKTEGCMLGKNPLRCPLADWATSLCCGTCEGGGDRGGPIPHRCQDAGGSAALKSDDGQVPCHYFIKDHQQPGTADFFGTLSASLRSRMDNRSMVHVQGLKLKNGWITYPTELFLNGTNITNVSAVFDWKRAWAVLLPQLTTNMVGQVVVQLEKEAEYGKLNADAILSIDYEPKYRPSWNFTIGENAKAEVQPEWEALLALVHGRSLDLDWIKLVRWACPGPRPARWGGLSKEQSRSLQEASWNFFVKAYLSTALAKIKAEPKLTGLRTGFWNWPFKFWMVPEVKQAPPRWRRWMDELGWLWRELDVFLPDLYPEFYAGAAADRPSVLAKCSAQNASVTSWYYDAVLNECVRLRQAYNKPATKILLVGWYHYMCGHPDGAHPPMDSGFFSRDGNVDALFESAAGVPGTEVALWGSLSAPPDDNAAQLRRYLDATYAPAAQKYCRSKSLKTTDGAHASLNLPWAPNRLIFPSFRFGQNLKSFDSDKYLTTVVGRHALAIYGWQHALALAPVGQSEGEKLSSQCAALKRKRTYTRCAVYRQGWLAMSNYNEQRAVLLENATKTKGWWQLGNVGKPTLHSGSGVPMLFYDFTSAEARQFYQEQVVRPLTKDSNIDAVFFDDMPGACCGSEHDLPKHYTKAQALAMCDGTLQNFKAVAAILVKGAKLPIFSTFQMPTRACLYTQQEILTKLGAAANFARFAQSLQSDTAPPPGHYGGNCSTTIEQALSEVAGGLSYIQWEDLRGISHGAAPQNLSEAVFMITRGAGSHDYSFYGASKGWDESDWAWQPSYSKLSKAGAPVGVAKKLGGGRYSREYEHASVTVTCATTNGERSTGSIQFKSDDQATARLGGVFLSAYQQDVAFSQSRWDAEFDALSAVGIGTVIIGESASSTWPNYSLASALPAGSSPRIKVFAFWPTTIGSSVPGYQMIYTGHDYISRVLTSADAHGFKVILGNADVPWVDQGGNQTYKMQAALSRSIVAELWKLYGHHASVAGFYNVVELSCDVRNEQLSLQIAEQMFGPFATHIKSLRPSLRAVTSPYYRAANISDPGNHQMTALQWASFWRKLLAAAPLFDTIAPQDGCGAGGNSLATVGEYLRALKSVTTALNRTLWSNIELFEHSAHCKHTKGACSASCADRRPANFSRVLSQMCTEAPIADAGFLVAYEWQAYLSPHSTACDGKTKASTPDWHSLPAAQYERYRRYVSSLKTDDEPAAFTVTSLDGTVAVSIDADSGALVSVRARSFARGERRLRRRGHDQCAGRHRQEERRRRRRLEDGVRQGQRRALHQDASPAHGHVRPARHIRWVDPQRELASHAHCARTAVVGAAGAKRHVCRSQRLEALAAVGTLRESAGRAELAALRRCAATVRRRLLVVARLVLVGGAGRRRPQRSASGCLQ